VIEPEEGKKLRIFNAFVPGALRRTRSHEPYTAASRTGGPRVLNGGTSSPSLSIFRVQIDQILTFRILTSGVEADQAYVTPRSSTHATALSRIGSISFICVTQEDGERVKVESHSRILIVRPISCNSPIGHALHAPWHTLPTHIIASP
jgi:hypothetical protein